MRRIALLFVSAALAAAAFVSAGERAARVEAASGERVREWSGRVDRLLAAGELAVRLTRDDTMIPGRRHERLAQLHRGVPVFGGELVRQSDAAGTLTVFGTLYEGIDVEVAPRLGSADAEARLAARGGRPFGSGGGPELVVLPLADGSYRLAWRVRALFEEWTEQIENEIFNYIKETGTTDPEKLAEHFKLSKNSINFFLTKLAQKGKIKLRAEKV